MSKELNNRGRGLLEPTEQLYVTKQEQLGKMDGYHNLNWKQLKDKQKMNFRVNLVKMLHRNQKQQKMNIPQKIKIWQRIKLRRCRETRECRGSE